ncbi:MAG: magnesium transporter CorA family protein [Planctomycetota bacterium]|nr:magnesium transporter CorA family protein [Planctomycetota bacterium]
MISSLYLTAVTTANGTLKQNLSDDEMRTAVRTGNGMLWLDLYKATPEEFFLLDEVFGFHPLAIEDCQHTSKFPKLDEFASHVFISFLTPNPNYKPGMEIKEGEPSEEAIQEINIFLGPNYVVTNHQWPMPFLQTFHDRAKRDPKRVLGRGASFFCHDILDAAVDQFFLMVEKIQDEAEEAELALHKTEKLELLTGMLELKRRVLSLRRQMNDHRELIQRLLRDCHPACVPKSHAYYRDILDHLNRIENDLDVCRDTIDHAREVYIAVMDARANQVMKLLTLLFTVSLPFTILTGWFGMNFKDLPLLEDAWAPWAVTALMFALAGGILGWLRYRKFF